MRHNEMSATRKHYADVILLEELEGEVKVSYFHMIHKLPIV